MNKKFKRKIKLTKEFTYLCDGANPRSRISLAGTNGVRPSQLPPGYASFAMTTDCCEPLKSLYANIIYASDCDGNSFSMIL